MAELLDAPVSSTDIPRDVQVGVLLRVLRLNLLGEPYESLSCKL